MVDRVLSDDVALGLELIACVHVEVKVREVGTADVQPQAMTLTIPTTQSQGTEDKVKGEPLGGWGRRRCVGGE